MKQVGLVTGNQFGFIYLGGIPYNPTKVKRFIGKGMGIKLQDIVIFEADESRVLSFIKNAKYMDSVEEKRMVKEFVRASQLSVAKMGDFNEVSDEMKKELAEEGIVITNDGVFKTPAVTEKVEVSEDAEDRKMNIHPDLLAALTPDQKRTLSIYLQSCLKIASDSQAIEEVVSTRVLKADALELAIWVDNNSTRILESARRYLEVKE